MGTNNPLTVSRRKAMSYVGSAAVGLTALTNPVSANSGARLEGYAYDPVTHEIVGEASGQFNSVHEDLRGNLRVNGSSINMSGSRKVVTGQSEVGKYSKYRKPKSKNDKRTNAMLYSDGEDAISGYVLNDTGNKIGFSLGRDPSKIVSLLENTSKQKVGDSNE